MWQKITTLDQLQKLVKGQLIIKYPIGEDPVDTLENALNENILCRYVYKNDTELKEIELIVTDSANNDEDLGAAFGHVIFSPIKKDYKQIIDDGRFWVRIK